MARRFFWIAVTLSLLVWSGSWMRHVVNIFDVPFSRQVFKVSIIACVIGVLLLVPLAIRWDRGHPRRIRRLRASVRVAAVVAIVLDAASLWLHVTLDHGPGNKYPGWDLGLLVFGWHHAYFWHSVIVGLLVLWLATRHADWTSPSLLESTPQSRSVWVKRLESRGQLAIAVVLISFLLIGRLLTYHPGPTYPSDNTPVSPKNMVVTAAETLAGGPEPSETCSLRRELLLERDVWVAWVEDEGVAAICRYLVHTVGTPDDEECLLEFPVATASGLEAASLAARIPQTYYRNMYGENGLRLYADPTTGRLFVLLDGRWCRWTSVASGIRIVP